MPSRLRRNQALLVPLLAAIALSCAHRGPAPQRPLLSVRLLALNDLHGQIEPGQVDHRRAGGAPVLASWLRAARVGREGSTLLLSAGDLVGASPPASGLLQDEPTIAFLNLLANDRCTALPPERRADRAALEGDPRCDVVATVGNHEFDEGIAELLRLVRGGDHQRGPFLEAHWQGARFPYVSASVVDSRTRAPVFPPAVVRELGGARVGVVGAVFQGVPTVVNPQGVAGLEFLEPAEAVNGAVRALKASGVRAIVVLLHEGGRQEAYPGPTQEAGLAPAGEIAALVARLDGEVDVVASAHTHRFTNARLPNAAGRPVLVAQAFSAGTAFARIDLGLDAETGDVVESSAEIVEAAADAGPGLTPAPDAERLLAEVQAKVGPKVNRMVATAAGPIRGLRAPGPDDSGESALGDLVADAYRKTTVADVAFVQPGGLRADLREGPIAWRDVYSVQPFGNALVRMTLSGSEMKDLLEQQFSGRAEPCVLQVSGLRFTWDASRPEGDRVVEATLGQARLDPGARYAVVVPAFLAAGGDHFTRFADGRDRTVLRTLDVDAVASHLASLPQPVKAAVEGRISRRR
jgi:5'-nucleotidase